MIRRYLFEELKMYTKDNLLLELPEGFGRSDELNQKLHFDMLKFGQKGMTHIQMLDVLPKTSSLIDKSDREILRLTENTYKYDTDAKHYILWVLNLKNFNLLKAKNFVCAVLAEDYIIWQNPPERRSILDITHYHILTK